MLIELIALCILVIIVAVGVRAYLNDEDESPVEDDLPIPPVEGAPEEISETPPPKSVQYLDIPKRAVNALEDDGVYTLDNLRDVDDLTSVPGIGQKYAEEIEEELKEM